VALVTTWRYIPEDGVLHKHHRENLKSLDQLATINLEVVPFCRNAPFPTLLPFFKCILEVMFGAVCNSASIISVVSKWQSFGFFFIGETEKSQGAKSSK
jgi:hypothetical protein